MSIEEKLLQEFNEREVANGRMHGLCSKVVDAEQRLKEKLNVGKGCETPDEGRKKTTLFRIAFVGAP